MGSERSRNFEREESENPKKTEKKKNIDEENSYSKIQDDLKQLYQLKKSIFFPNWELKPIKMCWIKRNHWGGKYQKRKLNVISVATSVRIIPHEWKTSGKKFAYFWKGPGH